MTGSIAGHLIRKDWQLHKAWVLGTIAAGVVALGIAQIPGEIPGLVGMVWFFVSLVILASSLPGLNIINERKKQQLPFLMSLPISPLHYARAKFASTVGMFLLPWVVLVAAALAMIFSRSDVHHGVIPALAILAGATLTGFCVTVGAAVISEHEGWTMAASGACNTSYWFVWYMFIRNPQVQRDLGAPVAVWSPYVLKFAGTEVVAIVAILAAAFIAQSRKKNFL